MLVFGANVRNVLISTAVAICIIGHSAASAWADDRDYFQIQSYVIQTSIARELATLKTGIDPHPDSFPIAKQFVDTLSSQHNVDLKWTDKGYVAYDRETGKKIDIYARKDWNTIKALMRDCNELLDAKGRLACEFGCGYIYSETPFSQFLFNVQYLKHQSQQLVYRDGRYELITKSDLGIPLEMYDLLNRNALVSAIHFRLLAKTTSILLSRELSYPELSNGTWDTRAWLPKTLMYRELNRYYSWIGHLGWDNGLNNAFKIGIDWTESDFEAIDLETNERIVFPHDQDLIDDALRGLNYYREKVNFSEHFMLANYPIYLLSILRLYDVNLQVDEASCKIITAPGSTDPGAFFDIVAECTFVNDPSDTEYLKEHLTDWLLPDPPKTEWDEEPVGLWEIIKGDSVKPGAYEFAPAK
jgi:hypothetical protein